MKKILYLLFITSAVFASCSDAHDSLYTDTVELLPAATYMDVEETHSMSLWVDLLNYTNMYTTMNLSADYTCFVPDNEAMTNFLASKNISSVTQLSMDEALLLVRYHTIKGSRYSSVDFNEGLVSDSTASGDYLSTAFLENGGAIRINMESTVESTKLVSNGYIHKIDAVLTPVSETVWGELENSDNYSIMRDAFRKIGYEPILDSPIKAQKYTLFAVPNTVFAEQGIHNVDDLTSFVGSDKLSQYLTYHLINQQLSYSVLSEFAQSDKVRSKNYNTMAEYQLINVSDVNTVLYINYQTSDKTGVQLTKLNKNCKNGVIHTVDNIMPVKVPKASKVQWEFTNYPEMSALPGFRSTPTTTAYSVATLTMDCYKWLSVPESKLGWFYYIPTKSDAVRLNALNKDYLVLFLGYYGWIEMQSPAVIAGTYNVILEHYNPKAAEKAGKLSFILDGSYVGSQITTIGASTKTDQFLKTTIGQVQFTTTTTHKLRILSGDTSTSYIDCLTFEPVTK